MRTYILSVSMLIIWSSCGLESRRQDLDQREQTLNKRELALLLREKEVKLLEDSLKRNFVLNNSVGNPTLPSLPLPDSLAGRWNVNMLCTKTNCSGSAVGDTRKEIWLFADREGVVSIQAFQGEKIVRVYTGTFSGTGFKLEAPLGIADSLAQPMTVDLKIENTNKMSGERTITQPDGCTTVFTIDINR